MTFDTPDVCMTVTQVNALLRTGVSCRGESTNLAKFHVGDRVRAKVVHPITYTRLPRYVRGKVGIIMKDHGIYVFPDNLGQRFDPNPQHVYSVRFGAQELWGMNASSNDALFIDLFDDHLDPVSES